MSKIDPDAVPRWFEAVPGLPRLRVALTSAPGLLIVSADPGAGTSQALRVFATELDTPLVFIDARRCRDSVDLAMSVADAAVFVGSQDAWPWWRGSGRPDDTASLQLTRRLTQAQFDVDDLRFGVGPPERLLDAAWRLVASLADGRGTIVIDHFGPMLTALSRPAQKRLLADLRTLRQQYSDVDVVLVEYPDGLAADGVSRSEHPLFQAGQVVRVRRPPAEALAHGLADPQNKAPEAELLRMELATTLAAGSVPLTLRLIGLADLLARDLTTRRPGENVLRAWSEIVQMAAPQLAQVWDALRGVHTHAQTLLSVLACGLPARAVTSHPVEMNANSQRLLVNRLRDAGVAYQPEPRTWAVADPLLADWAQLHAPPWVVRRAAERPSPARLTRLAHLLFCLDPSRGPFIPWRSR